MKHVGLTALLFFIITYCSSQEISNDVLSSYSIRSSVFSIGGSSNTLISNNKTYNISQSFGQSGVIGTFVKKDYTLRQGFQQPLLSLKNGALSSFTLNCLIYPNPFNQFLNISFNERIKREIQVYIYDLTGKPVLYKKYRASQFIYIPIRNLANGIYVLNASANNKKFSAKLIKQ